MINNTTLIGRLTKDIEMHKTVNGTSVCTFNIAVERPYKREDGKRDVDFFQIQAWKHNAEFIAKYGRKGNMVAIVGRLANDVYEKDGTRTTKTYITADSIQILSRNEANTSELSSDDNSSTDVELPF